MSFASLAAFGDGGSLALVRYRYGVWLGKFTIIDGYTYDRSEGILKL